MTGLEERNELRSLIRKSRVLDKAETLFWQKGYQSTTIVDIANACGCRPGNIYNYFKSKEDILYGVINDITSRAVALVEPLGEDMTTSPAELLKSLIKTHFAFLAGMKQSIVFITDTALKDLSPDHRRAIIKLRKTYEDTLLKILRRGKESGDFADIDERIVSYLIPSLIVRSNVWFSPKGRLSVDEVSDIIFQFAYLGIRPRNDRRIPVADCLPVNDLA
jgi:TetR/AcrR family transcriptional regulator, cholesterol catabolism regulator